MPYRQIASPARKEPDERLQPPFRRWLFLGGAFRALQAFAIP